jgi:hypothetical protein
MIGTIMNTAKGFGRLTVSVGSGVALLLMVCLAVPAQAKMDESTFSPGIGYGVSGIFEQYGDFVMNVGEVQMNITNFGLIGSYPGGRATFSHAPSCQWPAGSGDEYLFAGGLWVGGVVLGERLCSMGGYVQEWQPLQDDLDATIYEAIDTKLLRPAGNPDASGRRAPVPGEDDDGDGQVDEETLNGKDDDDDGLIDEDFGQIGNQMFVLTNYDNTPQSQEQYADHTPMNLQVVQSSFQWENDQVDDFVGFDFKITNIGVLKLQRIYIGFFADSDIGPRGGDNIAGDDMAGSWRGVVRGSDNSWVPIEVGFMWDAAENGRLDGYFGIVFLGHDIDPTGNNAPVSIGLRTFQKFAGQQAFDQGGDPTNDDEAYQLLSAEANDWDPDTSPTREDDFRFLVSAGPFSELEQDETLNFQAAMVVGPGLGNQEGGNGLLANCAEAALTFAGIWVDDIPDQLGYAGSGVVVTGEKGRETMLCRNDFEVPGQPNMWDNFFPDFGDTTCVNQEFILTQNRVRDEDKFEFTFGEGDTRVCAMFNMDNCFECGRQLGPNCNRESFEENGQWNCNDPDAINTIGCTGVDGAETQIRWLVGMAPPPPGLRVWSGDSRVHVFWNDTSENTPDIRLQKIDFESYRIWRADNWGRPDGASVINGPESTLWQLINEFDLVNSYVVYRDTGGGYNRDTIPLGANTGLDIVSYTPRVLSDPLFEGLAEAMNDVVMNDPTGSIRTRPDLRSPNGLVIPDYAGLVRWETYPDVLDTFFEVAYRAEDQTNGVVEKRSTKFYEYIDRDIHNGFMYFYSVTATDHALLAQGHETGIDLPIGTGLGGDPGSSFNFTTPGTESQSAEDRAKNGTNIYVFPNPATRSALEEYQQLYPSGEDPTGVRVTFTNLPAANNTIQIYTVSGDLVQTITHSGLGGEGHTSWNLMSRNGQEIVSGVYLYTVQSDNDGFEDFIGKFVVVR